MAELRRRGWPQARLLALGGGNFERVLARVEQAADRSTMASLKIIEKWRTQEDSNL